MANRKRKRPHRRPPGAAGDGELAPTSEPRRGPSAERRERKQAAREARERARKHAARRDAIRRATLFLVVGAVAFGAFWVLSRAASPGALTDDVASLVRDEGCSLIEEPVEDPSRDHLEAGAAADYQTQPAVAGPHDPTTLGTTTKVFTEPVRQETAVHTLEHGGVILYHRAGAVTKETVDGLADIARAERPVFAAPSEDLAEGDGLAFVAWNTLLTCPADVPTADAVRIARGFVDAFACTSRAPESGTSEELC